MWNELGDAELDVGGDVACGRGRHRVGKLNVGKQADIPEATTSRGFDDKLPLHRPMKNDTRSMC